MKNNAQYTNRFIYKTLVIKYIEKVIEQEVKTNETIAYIDPMNRVSSFINSVK